MTGDYGGVRVGSLADDRDVPLLPSESGGAEGSVDAFPVDSFRTDRYERPGTCDIFRLVQDCVPFGLARLGPESRELVLSLYRAVVERFYIMRATGLGASRPAGGAFCFCDVLLAGNDDPGKVALAYGNRRRVFGGVFWRAIGLLHGCAYRSTLRERTVGCVRFFPATPFYTAGHGELFLRGVSGQPYGSGRPQGFQWWPDGEGGGSAYTWRSLIGVGEDGASAPDRVYDFGTAWDLPGWMVDNSMQSDCRGNPDAWPRRGLLLRDFARAYAGAGFPDASEFGQFLDCWIRGASSVIVPSVAARELRSFGWNVREIPGPGCGPCYFGSSVDFGSSYTSFGSVSYLDVVAERFGGAFGCSFDFPSLALALRMLSVLNAQTVRRCLPEGMVPHRHVVAEYSVEISASEDSVSVGGLSSSVSITCELADGIRICGGLSYASGAYRAGWPARYHMVVFDLSSYGGWPEHPAEGETIVIPGTSWPGLRHRYGKGTVYSAPQSGTATAVLDARWPLLCKVSEHWRFDGAAYPAEWAVREGDVSFGAVSALVSASVYDDPGSSEPRGEHALVAVTTDNPGGALGGCGDLMSVLGRRLVCAAGFKALDEAFGGGLPRGNTFSDLAGAPGTGEAVALEVLGRKFGASMALFNQWAGDFHPSEDELPDDDEVAGSFNSEFDRVEVTFSAGGIEVYGFPYYRPRDGVLIELPNFDEDDIEGGPLGPGVWVMLGLYHTPGSEVSGSLDLRVDYNGLCGDVPVGDEVRHAWRFKAVDVQFGGAFGTFRFRNRAAVQEEDD